MEWIESLVLGVVQGLTEFLPVSSDGHLNVTQQAFGRLSGRSRSGKEDLFFDVMLHLGTLAAIAIYYRAVVRTGARGALGSEQVPPEYRRAALVRLGVMIVVATLPLIPWKFLKHDLEKAFQGSTITGFGFLVTAAALLVTTRLRGGDKGPEGMTWLDALLIGVAQAFAPLPGVSRSGLTVAMALGRGLSRSWAVGFSLLIAFPAILGATVLELKDVDRSTLSQDRIAQTVAATVVAGLVGYGAIIWLVKIVRHGRLWYFSVYLIVLATAVLALSGFSGGTVDAPRSKAVDRPSRLGAPGAGLGGRTGVARGSVDRPLSAGTRPDPSPPRREASDRPRSADLVLGRPLAGHR